MILRVLENGFQGVIKCHMAFGNGHCFKAVYDRHERIHLLLIQLIKDRSRFGELKGVFNKSFGFGDKPGNDLKH
jgi:hypothetical protein